LPNPLAIGISAAGLLLDVIAPRPKPRAGHPPQLSARRPEDTAARAPAGARVA